MVVDETLPADDTAPGAVRVPFEAIDPASVDEFAAWLTAVIDGGTGDVLLDLRDVDIVLAVGVQTLFDLDRDLLRSGRSLRIVRPSRVVRRVLELCDVPERWLG